MPTIKVQCTFTESDYKEIMRANHLKNWQIFGVLALSMFFGAIVKASDNIEFDFGSILFIFVFFLLGLSLTLVFAINPTRVIRMARKDPRAFILIEYEVNDQHIVLKNQFAETKFNWTDFHKFLETKTLFLLINLDKDGRNKAIPKRAFRSSEDEEAFRSILISKRLSRQNLSLDIRKNARFVIVLMAIFGLYVLIFAITVGYPIYNTFR